VTTVYSTYQPSRSTTMHTGSAVTRRWIKRVRTLSKLKWMWIMPWILLRLLRVPWTLWWRKFNSIRHHQYKSMKMATALFNMGLLRKGYIILPKRCTHYYLHLFILKSISTYFTIYSRLSIRTMDCTTGTRCA
jgi:hypothetical protein